ncbi:MAG: efflux RND transporter periplasmic adaptor subunit [Pseudomonadota bacterium]
MRQNLIVRYARRREGLIAAAVLLIAVAGGLVGYLLAGGGSNAESVCPGGTRPLYWYDPMIPDEHHPAPGKSSMNMDTIPKCPNEGAQGGVSVSPAMQQSLGIRLALVETRDIAPIVNAVGQVQFDERLISQVQTLTPGFVEQLAVRAEGEPVGAGRVIASVYSPDLLGAQNEYKALLSMRSPSAASLKGGARSRLKLLGLPEGAVQRLERGGAPQRTYPVVARSSGVVTQIGARPGAQVTPGQSIVTIQGLGQVLVVADVPEASLGSVHVGQPAEISFPAYAGDIRKGVVDYIYPSFNAQARTARVRITLPNPGLRLKQGMFANVTLQGTGGMAIVVPSEAVIDTGRRQVVIVKRSGAFVPQEVRIGRDYAEWTEIVSGLQRGEQVVASGQFLIDSEASLSGVISRLQSNPAAPPRTATGHGIVTAIDTARQTVTIRHQPIPEMRWPGMTMTFKAAEPAMLRGLRKGLKVQFAVEMEPRDNSFVIDRIAPEPGS